MHDGRFIMALEVEGKLVMHPQVEETLRYLVKIKASLASLAIAKPRLAELNDLAEPRAEHGVRPYLWSAEPKLT